MNLEQVLDSVPSNLGSNTLFTAPLDQNSNNLRFRLQEGIQINRDASAFQSAVGVDQLSAATAKASGVDEPRYISNQILLEPLKALSPDSMVNNAIGANSTMAEGFLATANQQVDRLADLSQNPTAVRNDQLRQCVESAARKCSTLAEVEADHAELANGNTMQVTFGSRSIAANAIRMHSDTTINTRTPHFGVNSQDYHVQANNSAVLVSDVQLNQTRQSLHLVEGAAVTSSQTNLNVSSDSQDNISRNLRNTGVDQITNMGRVNQNVADERMLNLSGGTTENVSTSSMSTRAGGDINIVSSPTSSNAAIQAVGEEGTGDVATEGGQILIVGSAGESSTIVGLTRQGLLQTTTHSSISSSGGSNYSSGEEGIFSVSPRNAYIGSPDSGLMVVGSRVFINSISLAIPVIEVPQALEIPDIPALPKLPEQDLEKCIPDRFRSFDKKKSKTVEEGNFGRDSLTTFLKPNKGSQTSRRQSARRLDSITSQAGSTNAPSTSPSARLPGVSATDAADPTQQTVAAIPAQAALDVGAMSGSSCNVYVSKFEDAITMALTKALEEGSASISETLSSEDLEIISSRLTNIQETLTPEYIRQALQSTAGESIEEFLDSDLYAPILEIGLEEFATADLSLEDFPEDSRETAQTLLRLIEARPQAKESIIRMIRDAATGPAIGFLGFVSNALGSLSSIGSLNLPNLSTLTQLPNIISSGNIEAIVDVASSIPGISTYLNNDLVNLGINLISGNQTDLLSTVRNSVETQLGSILDPSLSGIIGPLTNEILNIQPGTSLDSDKLTSFISTAISSITGSNEIGRATEIFNSIRGLVSDVSSGNLLNLVTGGNLQNILSSLVGDLNTGVIQRVSDLILKASGTVEALTQLPELLRLMDSFNVPSLDQISTALSCLDLFNKIKDLLNSVDDLFVDDSPSNSNNDSGYLPNESDLRTARTIELLPRIVQLINTTKYLSPSIQQNPALSTTPTVRDLIEQLSKVEIDIELDECFRLPILTLAESDIQVLKIERGGVLFSLKNIDLIKNYPSLIPKQGEVVQLNISSYVSNGVELTPYQTNLQYTPFVLNFVVTEFNLERNIGSAVYGNDFPALVLEDRNGVLYEYSPVSIGTKLTATIVDSYIIK